MDQHLPPLAQTILTLLLLQEFQPVDDQLEVHPQLVWLKLGHRYCSSVYLAILLTVNASVRLHWLNSHLTLL